jgi:hypothetical protein
MTGYESVSGNPFVTRGNGSAHELLGNPAFFGGAGNFGSQQNPATAFNNQAMQGNPFLQQQQSNPFLQQNPYMQQGFAQQGQQGFAQQGQWPQFAQPGFGNVNPTWGAQSQFGTIGAQSGFQGLQNIGLQGLQGIAQQGFGNTGVYTTRAVDIDLTIPAQAVLARHPMEIQQYILQVVVPTLIDALTKRAMAHDIGQSVSFDVRGACVARVGI